MIEKSSILSKFFKKLGVYRDEIESVSLSTSQTVTVDRERLDADRRQSQEQQLEFDISRSPLFLRPNPQSYTNSFPWSSPYHRLHPRLFSSLSN